MNRLQNKKALITGGTTGIGLETARLFMKEGARVAITGTNPSTLKAAQEELGPDALVISSDAGNVAAQQTLAESIAAAFGSLDILVVNAGMVDMRPLGQWDEAAWDRSFNINLKGPWFLLQSLLPYFANPASVVLNGSVNAHIGMAGTGVYGATKAGLISLARTMSGELISRGIRVNAVSPGPIATPLYGKLGLKESDLNAVAASLQQQVPAARFGTPLEVANAILFFASDEAAYMVGSELIIDGGLTTVH